MKRCRNLVDVGRRQFLRGSTMAAAGLATAAALPQQAKA
ncbi:MAG: twin-arginine translocation signal domain-containing protein, partial [Rhodomicrobium sp.]|nr:twin-arginine translocation signal domain-containing protein [Rhodomicrobium sp.]